MPIQTDRAGNALPQHWTPVLTVWASIRPQYGRENLDAGRLESTVKAVLTVRNSGNACEVHSDDRVVTLRTPYQGTIWAIQTITPMPGNREIEMTLESGVAP